MTWETRTKPAVYTAPSGARVSFGYESLDKSFEKQTSAHTFPGLDGTYVQDQGTSSRRYPMRAIFWGRNHDIEAARFLAALAERGRGRLEHPRDGSVFVLPFGTVTTREDLVTEANQTIVEVEFWESLGEQYPGGVTGLNTAALEAVDESYAAIIREFTDNIDVRLPSDLVKVRNRLSANVDVVRLTLGVVAGQDSASSRTFNRIADSIIAGVDSFESDPSIIAGQVVALVRAPLSAGASPSVAAVGYGGAVDALTARTDGGQGFKADELFAMATATAYVESSVTSAYPTRTGSLSAASEVGRQLGAVNTWREVNYAAS